MYFHTDRHSHQSQTHYSDIIDVGAPWIPVVKVFRWRWFPSSAYQLPKTLWCLKKKTQFFLTEKLIFTFLWQKPGEFTETLSPFWRQDTCSFFKKNVKDFRAVESFTQKIGSLLLTCLRSLAVLFRTRMLDMIFISTGRWEDWAGRRALLPFLCHGGIQQMSSLRRTRKDRIKKFLFQKLHFFPLLITLRAAMTDCTDSIKEEWKQQSRKKVPLVLFHWLYGTALCNLMVNIIGCNNGQIFRHQLGSHPWPWSVYYIPQHFCSDATAAPQPELLLRHLGFPSLSQCDPNLAKRKRTCLLWGKAERFWRLHHLQELGALCRRENWLFRGKQELSLKEEQASDWRGAGNVPGVKRSSHVTKEKALQNSSQGSYLWGCGGQAA